MSDFMIVGQGLAASVLMHTLHERGSSFTVISNPQLSNCSRIAAGIWNPVVFNRLTSSWLADDLIPYLTKFYSACGRRMGKELIIQRPIIKPFTEDHEKALWLKKSGAGLEQYLDPTIHDKVPAELEGCNMANGYGVVKQCGNLNVAEFLEATEIFFKDQIVAETFDHAQLQVLPDKVVYKTWEAKQIVFCEGSLVAGNPFFSWIPLKPAKGEILTVEIADLKFRNLILNKGAFLMDIGPGLFKLGATYEWQDLSEQITTAALHELTARLEQMTALPYTVKKQDAGIRPSSLDRRPLIGKHPRHERLFVFNGLGTKGVMLAPFFANNFVNFCLQNQALHREVDLARFYSLYETHHA